jgi:DNA-binding IclR family transcriptional regulator
MADAARLHPDDRAAIALAVVDELERRREARRKKPRKPAPEVTPELLAEVVELGRKMGYAVKR